MPARRHRAAVWALAIVLALLVGFTPGVVTAVWGGNDDNLPIPGSRVTGGSVMASIWRDYTSAYYRAYPSQPLSFTAPLYPLRDDGGLEEDVERFADRFVDGLFRDDDDDNSKRQESKEKQRSGLIGRMVRGLFKLF